MDNVIVTGGAGFIGNNLIKLLVHKGYNVLSYDNYSSSSRQNELPNVEYFQGDINEIDTNLKKNNFKYCFHLAAQSRVQPSFDDPQQSFHDNVSGTISVLEWAKKNNIKLIYAGSSSKHHDYRSSPYATTKFIGEEICKLYKTSYNLHVEIARFYNVYGPYEPVDSKLGNVIGIWRSLISKNKPIPIVGDGEQRRDFTHVNDIVDGILKIAETNKTHIDAWELGSGINYSINELALMFKKKFNVNSYYIDEQPGNFRESLRINNDCLKLLNWKPKDRIKDYINNLK